jgi:hypothetical protein
MEYAAISENNQLKRYTQSKDFPDWAFRCKVGHTLPQTTVLENILPNQMLNTQVWKISTLMIGSVLNGQ